MSQRCALGALLAAVAVAAACAPEAAPRSAHDEDPGQPGVPGSAPPAAPSVVISARVTITLGDSGGQPGAEAAEGDAEPASPAASAGSAARPEPTLVVRGALVQLGPAGASARLLLLPKAPTRCTPAPPEKGAYALEVQWEAGAVARFVRMATGEPTYSGGLRVNDAPRTAGAKGRITLDDEPDHTVVGGAVDVLVCP